MATAPSPNDLTRQQLDELDALLQRMLSVPLAPTDTPMPVSAPPLPTPPSSVPSSVPSWRVDPPGPTNVSSPHIALSDPPSAVSLKYEAPSSPPPAAAPAPVSKQAPPVHKPTESQATLPWADPLPPVAAPAPQTRPAAPAPVAPPPVSRPAERLTPAPTTQPVPFFFLPFVALNVLFDTACGLFGPPGQLLRSGFFKYLYGLAGVALLAYTAAHVAQEQKWLTLPIQLPWPPSRG